jgi:2Fe-2S ferredoxin
LHITVTDRDGTTRGIEVEPDKSLMQALLEHDYGIEAQCGGVASCGTCHIYVDPAFADRLPEKDFSEEDVLAASHHERPESRLACQIPLKDELDGLTITLAPVD